MTLREKVQHLVDSGTPSEVREFLWQLPPEIEADEHLRQHVVVLHDKIDAVDPLISGHVFWHRSKQSTVLEQRPIGDVIFTIQVGSVLETVGANYVAAACGDSLDPQTFPLGGLLQHINQFEGASFFDSFGDGESLEPLDIVDLPSRRKDYHYLFVNLGEKDLDSRPCTLDDVAQAYRKILQHVSKMPNGRIVSFPILGWRSLSDDDRSRVAPIVLDAIRSYCQQTNTGLLREIRLCLYTLEASFHFARAVSLARQDKIHELITEKESIRDAAGERTDLVYDFGSPAFRHVRQEIDQFIQSDISIAFVGETGVGKTYFAKYVHEHSGRRGQPFKSIACNEYSTELLLNHLWGWKRGAFTGATNDYIGRVRMADKGTLLIDEIDKMSLEAQSALLQFIDTKEVHTLLDKAVHKVNVRLLFASIVPLEVLVAHGAMLKDFYHRIVPPQIMLPPLRDRKEDILPTARMWLEIYARLYNKYMLCKFDADVENLMLVHPWPGNVRELQRTIEATVLRAHGDTITMEDLLFAPSIMGSKIVDLHSVADLERHVYEIQRTFYTSRLNAAEGNVSEAARQLGIPVKTLHSRFKELGLP